MGIADKDYFLDANRNLTDSEEERAFVLIRAGQEIPKEMADKYGIGKVAQEAGAADDEETVKAAKPAANKAVKPAKNKEE